MPGPACFGRGGKVTEKDITLFTRQLATMMKAGVPLLQSFDIVGKGHSNPSVSKLVMDLRRFEADYTGGALPSAVVEVNAKLVNNRGQRVVASRTFLQQKPANSVDVAQVATAFEEALEAATADIAGWVLVSGNGDPNADR